MEKENIDRIEKLWLPDPKQCTAQEELRRIEEWKRKNGGTKKPSELGIDNYRWGNKLPAKFYEGRTPPQVSMDSAENLEWYEEQIKRSIHGFEYKGIRITGDHYWMLNFTPFVIAVKDKDGNVTTDFEIDFPYFSYQHDYIFKLIEEAHSIGKGFMMMGGRGYGKQQPDSEVVITPDGNTTMGELIPGDMVVGSDGEAKKVLQVHPQGKDDVYEVKLKDGRKIRCGLEHLWTVYNRAGRLVTLELKDMIGDIHFIHNNNRHNNFFIPTGNGANFSKKQLPISPYFLGALLGDGSFNNESVRLVIVEHETEILEKIKSDEGLLEDTDYTNNWSMPIDGTKEINRVYFRRSSGILQKIKQLKLSDTNTYTKFIPKKYLLGSKEQRLELLQGLCDTDGYISKKGNIEYTTASKSLADDVVTLARSLGIKAALGRSDRITKLGKHSLVYRVRMYTILPLFILPRKASRQKSFKYTGRKLATISKTAIVNIKKLDYKEHSTCITVDAKDSLYLTTDFTVTHNTYMILSILAKTYYLKPESLSLVSASNSNHADEAFSKMKKLLSAVERVHPTLALARLTNTKTKVISGYEVTRDGVKREEGPMSELRQVVYGDNSGAVRGWRPDAQLLEEIGDWSTGKADLKRCFSASEGSWRVGSIFKCRVFMVGTGGSVASDQAKDMFTSPDAYNMLSVNDFSLKAGRKHCVFVPAQYLYGGADWERTGVNNNEWAEKVLTEERELKKEDGEIYQRFTQEFPFTVEEVFSKMGTNIFHQRNIAKQWTDIEFKADHIITPEIGLLEWKRSKTGKIVGVEWNLNPNGNIYITEHPYHGKNSDTLYNDLYVAGIDSIDQGQLDSTSNKNKSSLAILIKKRLVEGEYFKQVSNLYVAKYVGRSLDVRDDYEEALKLSMYYSAKVNIEYTKVGIVQYFRERKKWNMFMKRPMIAKSTAGSGDLLYIKKLREQTLIGTTVTPIVIDHQDGKIKEYTRDLCHQIYFSDLLEQLRDYKREDRTDYDLVVAMGLCEIADEDLLNEPAKPNGLDTAEFVPFGYFMNDKGKKVFDSIRRPKNLATSTLIDSKRNGFRWVDVTGNPRFDDKFDILDKRDLETADY